MPDVTDTMLSDDATRHGIGGNNPPDPIEALRVHLRDTYTDLAKRFADIMAMADRLPAAMDDDAEAKLTEAIKVCTKFSRNAEVCRLEANEPHRALIAATDGFFKAMSDKVDGLKKKMNTEYLTPYQQEKTDREKRRREEEARAAEEARKEQERLKRAEEKRAAAEVRRAEEAKREAARQLAEAKAAKDKEAADKAKAEKEAAQRAIEESKEKNRREAAEAKAEADRVAQEEVKERIRLADERREQQRIADKARDDAAAAAQRANATKKAAGASQADMSRTRTDLGAIASLRTVYEHEVTDHDQVPRQYCRVDDGLIASAVRAATVDGKCSLKIPGVRIYPKTDSVVR
ncbi:MAG: hypothetical protein B7Z41_09750 [Rhizobiales bacterium 12-66-7]|nr:MAG: hypothetical protein B7Z41_09750 [Rhizobiales bacterium 12-66-7]